MLPLTIESFIWILGYDCLILSKILLNIIQIYWYIISKIYLRNNFVILFSFRCLGSNFMTYHSTYFSSFFVLSPYLYPRIYCFLCLIIYFTAIFLSHNNVFSDDFYLYSGIDSARPEFYWTTSKGKLYSSY